MNIQNYSTPQDLHESAALMIADRIRKKPSLVLGLAAGKTPLPLYRRLIEMNRAGLVSFKKVHTFNLDEFWGVSIDSPSSFARFTQSNFTGMIDIPKENVHSLNGAATSAEAEIQRYNNLLKEAGGIELQILGLGLNGHIGFNEPGSSRDSQLRIVQLTETSRAANAYLFPNSKPPPEALTLGMREILSAKEVLLMVADPAKKQIFKECFERPARPDFPASFLQEHPQATVMTSF